MMTPRRLISYHCRGNPLWLPCGGGCPAAVVALRRWLLIFGGEQDFAALFTFGHPTLLELLHNLFDIIWNAPYLCLPGTLLPGKDAIRGAYIFIAWEATTANVAEQELPPTSYVGNMQMSKGQRANIWRE